MAIDRQIIGQAAAELLDTLDAKYGEDGELSAVMLIVAVDQGQTRGDTVEYRAYEGDGAGLAAWKAKGLLGIVDLAVDQTA